MSLISKKKRSEARKGWDETMKDVAGDFPLLQQKKAEKRETRNHLQRKNARRWTAYSSKDDLRGKIEHRLEKLEYTNHTDQDKLDHEAEDDDDDAYDDQDDIPSDDDYDAETPKKPQKRKRKSVSKKSAKKANAAKNLSRFQTKKFKPRSLAEWVLLEGGGGNMAEPHFASNSATNSSSTTGQELFATDAEFQDFKKASSSVDYVSAASAPSKCPPLKLCVATGFEGRYKDKTSGLHCASKKALEQIQEQPPPWVHLAGITPYFDALRQIQSDKKATAAAAKVIVNKPVSDAPQGVETHVPTFGNEFYVGQGIEALFPGETGHWPGMIESIGKRGRYNILYDDGDRLKNVDAASIRPLIDGKGQSDYGSE